MAGRPPTVNMLLHPSEDHCHLKMALNFEYSILHALDRDWFISFQIHMGEAKPVFWCKVCAFDYVMQLLLENELHVNVNLTNLQPTKLQPLIDHQSVCKAFHKQILQNAGGHTMQIPEYHHDQSYKYHLIVNSVPSPVAASLVENTEPTQEQGPEQWRSFGTDTVPVPSEPSASPAATWLPRRLQKKSRHSRPQIPAAEMPQKSHQPRPLRQRHWLEQQQQLIRSSSLSHEFET